MHTDINLSEAARSGRLVAVKFLVENGANIHADDNLALRHAAMNGHLDVVRFLVENGADIHTCDDWAIQWAAGEGYLGIVQFFIGNGAGISYLLDNEGNPTEITNQVLTGDQIKQAKQLFSVRKVMTD
jgi:ankyrin repeat protein